MSRTVKPEAVNTSKAGINDGGNPYNNLAFDKITMLITCHNFSFQSFHHISILCSGS